MTKDGVVWVALPEYCAWQRRSEGGYWVTRGIHAAMDTPAPDKDPKTDEPRWRAVPVGVYVPVAP